jgi:hypothetical protein
MALPINRPHNEVVVSANLVDISADTSTWAVAPVKGRLVRAYSVLHGAITGADCTWSVAVAGVAVTGTATVANASSAAGDVDSIDFSGDVRVNEGDSIEFNSAGESSTTAAATFHAVIRVG